MRLLHLPNAARRHGLDLLLLGFVAGIVLTITALSVMKDSASEPRHRLVTDDAHHVPLDHHHRRDVGDDVRVVDLAEHDKHKHTGTS